MTAERACEPRALICIKIRKDLKYYIVTHQTRHTTSQLVFLFNNVTGIVPGRTHPESLEFPIGKRFDCPDSACIFMHGTYQESLYMLDVVGGFGPTARYKVIAEV